MILFINILVLIVNGFIQIANVYVLFTCRILSGIFVGMYLGIVPIYIHELSPHAVSGSFGAFTQLSHILGAVFCYLLGMIFDLTNEEGTIFFWRFMFSCTSVFVLLQTIFFAVHYVPESPNSLLEKGDFYEAKNVLAMFNNPNPKNIEELVQEKKL